MTDAPGIPIVMPQMGESLAEGTVVRWLKAVGDHVAKDEPLFELSTDKVDTDVPSPAEGVLREILVHEGQTAAVGATVARLSGTEVPSPEADAGGHFKETQPARLVSFRERRGASQSGSPPAAATPGNRSYSPAVLETARRSGLSLATLTALTGSGRGGRLTKRDVERYLREAGPATAAPGTVPPAAVPPAYVYRPGPEDERIPMSPVRRQIAQHMTWSARISPHATAFTEVDMSVTAELLRSRREGFERDVGAPLTYTVMVGQAAVGALGAFRTLNASVVEDSLILKPAVHLGIAVALPDTEELIVPVVRDADELSISGLARAVDDLARRARTRRLQPADVQGGTFTLTNPGMFGGLAGTPILNQPQVAILGMGAITKRAVVVDDAIAIRPVVVLSLTFDHRAADGMIAFRYLEAVKQRLETGPDEGAW